MNQRGFTLVELLAVIIVIGLIAAFALPQVLNQYSNNSENLSKQQNDLLIESARSYVLENARTYKGKNSCISIKKLVDEDAIEESFAKQIFTDNYASTNYQIKASYTTDVLEIELVENCS